MKPQKWWFNQKTRDLRYLTGDKKDYLTSIGNLKGIPYFQKPNHHLLGCIFYPTLPYYPMNFPKVLIVKSVKPPLYPHKSTRHPNKSFKITSPGDLLKDPQEKTLSQVVDSLLGKVTNNDQ